MMNPPACPSRWTFPQVLLLTAVLSALGAFPGQAQSPAPDASQTPEPPPEPPLVVDAPPKVEWTINYQWADAKPGDAPEGGRLLATTTTKIDDKEREVSRWGDGKTSEHWIAGGLSMTQQPTWPPDMVVSEPRPPSEGDFGLNWIEAKHFQGTVTVENRKCHLYLAPDLIGARRGLKGEGGKGEPMIKVWVDAKTRLPIGVQTAECRKRFTYAPTTVTSLVLPPSFARRYELYLASQRPPGTRGR